MKAVSINRVSTDLDGVAVIDVPTPKPSAGQLRVRLTKAALHQSDLNYIRGEYREAIERLLWNRGHADPSFDVDRGKLHPSLPCTPGGEGVGVVDSCGDGVDAQQWLGKRVAVIAGPPNGTWQECVIATPQQLFPVPEALSDDQAALLMINPLTALIMSKYVLGVGQGQWLLMSAGASAVSKLVAALGRHYGFKTIGVVRRGPSPSEPPEQLADVVIDTTQQDLRDEVQRITNGRGVPFALDCVGGALGEQMITSLTDGGKMLLYGTLSGPTMTLHSRDLMMPNAFVGGFYLPGWLAAQTPDILAGVMTELGKLSMAGLLQSPVEAQYPLTDAVEAVRASLESGRTGKILLDCSNNARQGKR